jgi:hypothetical protein
MKVFAAVVAALWVLGQPAFAGIVDQYKASSDPWRAVQSGTRPGQPVDHCAIMRDYGEMLADIDVALIKGQLLLAQPNVRFIDLTGEDKRDLRAFYTGLEAAYGDAERSCPE